MEFIRILAASLPTLFAPQNTVIDLAALSSERAFYVLVVDQLDASNTVTLHCFPGPRIPGVDFQGEAQAFEVASGGAFGISELASIRSADGSLIHAFSYLFEEQPGSDPVLRIAAIRDGECAVAKTFEHRTPGGYFGTETIAVPLPSGDRTADGPAMFVVTGNALFAERIDLFASPPAALLGGGAGAVSEQLGARAIGQPGGAGFDLTFVWVGDTLEGNGPPYVSPFFSGIHPVWQPLPAGEFEGGGAFFGIYQTPSGGYFLNRWSILPGEPIRFTELTERLFAPAVPSPSSESNIQPERHLDGSYFFNTGGARYEVTFPHGAPPQLPVVESHPWAGPELSANSKVYVFDAVPVEDAARQGIVLGKGTDGQYTFRTFDGSQQQDFGEGVTEGKLKLIQSSPPSQPTALEQGGPLPAWKYDGPTHVFESSLYQLRILGYVGAGFVPVEGFEQYFFNRTNFLRGGPRQRGELTSLLGDRSNVAGGAGAGATCGADDTTDCVQDGRFRVRAWYRTPRGERGPVSLRTLTEDTGYGFIFDEANIELVYKTLDACALNGQYWVFIAGLTDLAIDLQIVDTLSGRFNVYSNPPDPFVLKKDIAAFACEAPGEAASRETGDGAHTRRTGRTFGLEDLIPHAPTAATLFGPRTAAPVELAPHGGPSFASAGVVAGGGSCSESGETLCLTGDRFQVEASFRTPAGASGRADAVELTGDTGYFWFFNQANVEVVLKVLDACAVNQHFWVFGAGLTDVEVEITVTDTETGEVQSYVNALGADFAPIQETSAFPCG